VIGRPRILVLATGGTIAGWADSAVAGRYASGEVGIDALLAFATDLGIDADLIAEQVASVGSQDMDAAIWDRLHGRIVEAFANDRADAVIVTHGTDTAEETGFLLDLVLPAGRPVVLVGAMRPGNAIGADGPRNLANAIRIANDPASRGRGVLVILGDTVFGAREVHKALTDGADAFRAFPGGPLGAVSPASLRYFTPPVEAPGGDAIACRRKAPGRPSPFSTRTPIWTWR
jgi:L-asparaginase